MHGLTNPKLSVPLPTGFHGWNSCCLCVATIAEWM